MADRLVQNVQDTDYRMSVSRMAEDIYLEALQQLKPKEADNEQFINACRHIAELANTQPENTAYDVYSLVTKIIEGGVNRK